MLSKISILSLVICVICAFRCRGQDVRAAPSSETSSVPSAPSELKQTGCSPDAAFEQALTVREGTKFYRFVAFVKKFNLDGDLKRLTRGKALFIPSDATLNNKFRSLGLYERFGSYDFNTYRLGSYRRSQFMRWVLLRLVRSQKTFNNLLNKQPGLALGKCQAVEGANLYGSKNTIEPVRPSNCSEPNFDAFMNSQARISTVGIREWVGRGYNILTGDPINFGLSDPGFASSPFSRDGEDWFEPPTTGNNKCIQSTTDSISSSAKDLQSKTANQLGVEAKYGPVSFTGSASWGSSFASNSAETAVTIEASTDALVAGSALKDILGLQLCSTFKYRVVNAIKNGEGSYNEAFRQLLGEYGSHYVKSVDFGGRARLVIKTSAKKLAQAETSSSNLEASVRGSYGLFSGAVDASRATEEEQGVYNALKTSSISQSSSPVYSSPTAPANEQGVDCQAYFAQLQNSPSLAPLNYKLVAHTVLFTQPSMRLWEEETEVNEAQLVDFGAKFGEYVASCSSGGCSLATVTCNEGFYGSVPNCSNCYGGSGDVGAVGSCHPSQSCDTQNGVCIGELPKPRNKIAFGEQLNKGDALYSLNERCKLEFTPDDNLVVKTRGSPGGNYMPSNRLPNSILQKIGSWGKGRGSEKMDRLAFSSKGYGNLLLVDTDGRAWWSSKTSNYIQGCTQLAYGESVYAVLQDDCNFVIYKVMPSGEVPIWSWYDSLGNGDFCRETFAGDGFPTLFCSESGC